MSITTTVVDAFGRVGMKIISLATDGFDKATMDRIEKKDPDYVWSDDLLRDLLVVWQVNLKRPVGTPALRSALITGTTGSGKSSGVKQLTAELGVPLMKINCAKEKAEAMLYSVGLKGAETVIEKGILLLAMEKGLPLLIDEVNVLTEDEQISLFSVLDEGIFVIPETGEVVRAKHGFMIFATRNPSAEMKGGGPYGGTHMLNAAFARRFTTHIRRDDPDEETMANIVDKKAKATIMEKGKPVERSIGMDIARKMAKVATQLKGGGIMAPPCLDQLVNWGRTALNYRNSHSLQSEPDGAFLVLSFKLVWAHSQDETSYDLGMKAIRDVFNIEAS